MSSGTVSRLNQKIYAHIEAWRNRQIVGEFPYLYVDGVILKRSWAGEVLTSRCWSPSASESMAIGRLWGWPRVRRRIGGPAGVSASPWWPRGTRVSSGTVNVRSSLGLANQVLLRTRERLQPDFGGKCSPDLIFANPALVPTEKSANLVL